MNERQSAVAWRAAVHAGDTSQLQEPTQPDVLISLIVLLDQIADETRARRPVKEDHFRHEDAAFDANFFDLIGPGQDIAYSLLRVPDRSLDRMIVN
jgi:hypothetical protein